MSHLIVEIKARCSSFEHIRKVLKVRNAESIGTDYQVDTYFHVPDGRLKLREGTIENNLIFYQRTDQKTPKPSYVTLYPVNPPHQGLKEILSKTLGKKVTVQKNREIYFINNVKIHLDTVSNLGTFVEIEAIDKTGKRDKDTLQQQCEELMNAFRITKEDLLQNSYSDMLLSNKGK